MKTFHTFKLDDLKDAALRDRIKEALAPNQKSVVDLPPAVTVPDDDGLHARLQDHIQEQIDKQLSEALERGKRTVGIDPGHPDGDVQAYGVHRVDMAGWAEHVGRPVSLGKFQWPPMMPVRIKRLHDDAQMPTYATDGSGCFDLYATDAVGVVEAGVMIAAGQSLSIGTGLAFEIPAGHAMLLFSRSGQGLKGIRLANCVGVIDSDYREEVRVLLRNDNRDSEDFRRVRTGDRIAQALILPIPRIRFEFADELTHTARTGGFGSTGA